jgi:hypothetical protein
MNKILWQNTGGMPITVEDLEFLYNSDGGELSLLNAYFAGFTSSSIPGFIITGCELLGGQIQSGYCFLDNRLVKVDAHSKGTGDYITIETTYPTEGRKVFKNNITHDTWVKERGVVGSTSGVLKYNGRRFSELFGTKSYLYKNTPPSFTQITSSMLETTIETIEIPSDFTQGRYVIEFLVDVGQTSVSGGLGMYLSVEQSAGSPVDGTGIIYINNLGGTRDTYLIYSNDVKVSIYTSFYAVCDIVPGETIQLKLINDSATSGIQIRLVGYIIN